MLKSIYLSFEGDDEDTGDFIEECADTLEDIR